ncbi:hypothetical protein DZ695_30745 [Klebsiella pneumoniae]|nr:hypothetical protein DZ695_30745 [Klebsiella pneumoniae]
MYKRQTLVKRVEHEAKLLPRISSLLEEHASWLGEQGVLTVSYTHLRAHETREERRTPPKHE